jgi:hypothetical protein
MDHFTLTLIIGALELLFVPWAAWITMQIFEARQNIRVIQSQMESEIKLQKLQNSNINKALEKLDGEIDEMKVTMGMGFSDVMEALRK